MNKEEIGLRFLKFRLHFELSLSALAKVIGTSQSYLGEIERGITNPSIKVIQEIAKIYSINLNWLINGEGSMLNIKEEEVIKDNKKKIISIGNSKEFIVINGGSKVDNVHIGNRLERKIIRRSYIPPEGSISVEQANNIKNYINKVVENAKKANFYPPQTYPIVWNSFKKKFRIPSYKELPAYLYEEAIEYFQQKLGVIRRKGIKSRNKNYFIKDLIKAIHAIYKTQLNWNEQEYRNYLRSEFTVLSSLDLTDNEVMSLYNKLKRLAQKK